MPHIRHVVALVTDSVREATRGRPEPRVLELGGAPGQYLVWLRVHIEFEAHALDYAPRGVRRRAQTSPRWASTSSCTSATCSGRSTTCHGSTSSIRWGSSSTLPTPSGSPTGTSTGFARAGSESSACQTSADSSTCWSGSRGPRCWRRTASRRWRASGGFVPPGRVASTAFRAPRWAMGAGDCSGRRLGVRREAAAPRAARRGVRGRAPAGGAAAATMGVQPVLIVHLLDARPIGGPRSRVEGRASSVQGAGSGGRDAGLHAPRGRPV